MYPEESKSQWTNTKVDSGSISLGAPDTEDDVLAFVEADASDILWQGDGIRVREGGVTEWCAGGVWLDVRDDFHVPGGRVMDLARALVEAKAELGAFRDHAARVLADVAREAARLGAEETKEDIASAVETYEMHDVAFARRLASAIRRRPVHGVTE